MKTKQIVVFRSSLMFMGKTVDHPSHPPPSILYYDFVKIINFKSLKRYLNVQTY